MNAIVIGIRTSGRHLWDTPVVGSRAFRLLPLYQLTGLHSLSWTSRILLSVSTTSSRPFPSYRQFHTSLWNRAEEPPIRRDSQIPRGTPRFSEASEQRLVDEFEEQLKTTGWFFRPLTRLLNHPENIHFIWAGQVSMIIVIISMWIYIWFFMEKPGEPAPKDGTGRELTEDEIAECQAIENYLHSHPIVQALRSQKYLIESRPHWAIPDKDIPHNLTGGTLRGLGRVSVAPIAFSDGEGKEFYAVLHVGKDLCGPHAGFVHDGVLATIVDESLARCCFPALPNRIGVTANLNITYKNPIEADSYLLVKVCAF